MTHTPSLAIWLGLGAAFMGLFTTFIALLASQQKKKKQAAESGATAAAQELPGPGKLTRPD